MLTQRISPNKNGAIGKILDGEAIIINLVTGSYYSTTGAGATIWQAIENRPTIPQIVALLTAEYDVDERVAREDVDRLLEELKREDLVLFEEMEAELHQAVPSSAARAPYESPVLTVYRDMSDLLALDPPMPVFGNVPKDWDGEPSR